MATGELDNSSPSTSWIDVCRHVIGTWTFAGPLVAGKMVHMPRQTMTSNETPANELTTMLHATYLEYVGVIQGQGRTRCLLISCLQTFTCLGRL